MKQFFMTMLSLVIIAYIVLQLALNIGDLVETETVTYASASEKIELKAYLFRDELPINSLSRGVNSYFFDDGEKVSKNEKIAITYSNQNDASIQNKIKSINKKIDILKKSAVNYGSSTTDIEKMDSKIASVTLSVLKAVDKNDLSEALRYKDELTIQNNRYLALNSSQDNYNAQIAALENEKKTLEGMLKGDSSTYTASVPGYFYSTLDGYENIFTMEKLNNLTLTEFDKLKNAVPDESLKSNSVGKLVLSPNWYIACELDKRTASNYIIGNVYNFDYPLSTDIIISMKLERMVTQSDQDRSVLIFSGNSMPDGFNYLRMQTVKLVLKTYEGLKIPSSSLRKINGETGVYALDGNKVIFKKAQVLFEENGYYICALPVDPAYPSRKNIAFLSKTNLSLYDTVIYSGRDIYEGKVLQ
jgi:hypothetical protein